MSSARFPAISEWRDLYLQALFETDRAKISLRIAAAEKCLLRRERELFCATDCSKEREALNAALQSLHALKSCLGLLDYSAAA